MKRLAASLLLTLFLIVLLSVPALALPIPDFTIVDGNTTVGILKLAKESEQVLEFWNKFKASDKNVVFYTNEGNYYFVIILGNEGFTINDYGNQEIAITSSGSMQTLVMTRDPSGDFYNFKRFYIAAQGVQIIANGVACGTIFKTIGYTPPKLSYNYIAEYTGDLAFVDDLDDGGGGGSEGFWGQIWDWLTSFWQKFIDTLIGLFVPPKDYYTGWFSEIRAAFEKKLGGMMDVINYIKTSLSNVSGDASGLSIMVRGTKVDLLTYAQPLLTQLRLWLTGIVVVWTAIRCYKRLISLTHR